MKINISILGSTGSIGLTSLKIVSKKSRLFEINTLAARKNYKVICKQIKQFNPKNFVESYVNKMCDLTLSGFYLYGQYKDYEYLT